MKIETYNFVKRGELISSSINGRAITQIIYVMADKLRDIGYVSFINTPYENTVEHDYPREWSESIRAQHAPVYLYQIVFMGKTKGALGIREIFSETSIGRDEDQAILNLYGMFDHIQVQKIEEL